MAQSQTAKVGQPVWAYFWSGGALNELEGTMHGLLPGGDILILSKKYGGAYHAKKGEYQLLEEREDHD